MKKIFPKTQHTFGLDNVKILLLQAFLDISKKTQAQKTQNSRRILKKLMRNIEKIQKPVTPVELS